MVIPDFLVVVNDSSAEAPSWVDSSSSDGDGSQVHNEHSKPNRQRSQHLDTCYHQNQTKTPKTQNPKKKKMKDELHTGT